MRHLLAILTVSALLCTLTGCARTRVQNPQVTDYPPGDSTAELDFWHGLPGSRAVSNDEGLHGVLLLFDGSDPTQSYDARVAALKERGWLSKGFDEPSDVAMQRGTLSYILVRAMDVKGGVMMHLTSRCSRYANLELQRLGIMPGGSEFMVIDGLDYVGSMSKAQDYMVIQGMRKAEREASENPEEPTEPGPESDPTATS